MLKKNHSLPGGVLRFHHRVNRDHPWDVAREPFYDEVELGNKQSLVDLSYDPKAVEHRSSAPVAEPGDAHPVRVFTDPTAGNRSQWREDFPAVARVDNMGGASPLERLESGIFVVPQTGFQWSRQPATVH
ncbi:MAG: hypothetical protein VX346_14760 [Planctomycetota bacterium]|nr:hypothetical protein [Planctomycetota bacterium]